MFRALALIPLLFVAACWNDGHGVNTYCEPSSTGGCSFTTCCQGVGGQVDCWYEGESGAIYECDGAGCGAAAKALVCEECDLCS